MKSNEKINRKLGSYELYNWMRDKITSCNFCVYASIKGKITDETLRISLNAIQKRHPLLRVRIIKRGWWGASYTNKDVPEIPLQIVKAKKEEIFQYLESEQHTKFPSEKGPLMRCLLLRHGDKNFTLITNFCHTVSDGVSGIYIMRDIINAIDDIEEKDEIKLPILELKKPIEYYLPKSMKGFSGLKNLSSFMKKQSQMESEFKPLSILKNDGDAPLKNQIGFEINRELEPKIVKKIISKAREHKVTVHCVLYSAFLSAIHKENDSINPENFPIAYDVNIRKKLIPPIGEDLGIFVSGLSSCHKVSNSTNFWNLASEIRSKMLEGIEKDSLYGLLIVLKLLKLLTFICGTGKFGQKKFINLFEGSGTIGISNLGSYNFKKDFKEFTIEKIGLTVHWGPFNIIVATFHDKMILNFNAMEPIYTRDHVARVADKTIDILKDIVK